jgi:prepilin signal peptidase PulO-like enzyme (type II secretory pathway)
MIWFFLFIFGLAIGSFINVVATRYDGDHFLFANTVIGGRSHCEGCKKTLRWFELIPLFSFLAQRGRCRRCDANLSFQYPLAELTSGLIFVFVPLAIGALSLAAIFWIIVFELLLLMSLIDIALGIIPDEICVMLAVLGILLAINNNAESRLIGAVAAGAFFGLLILITKGKGMGMGDLKLSIPLGLLFGWPNITLVLMFSFLTGAIAGLASIAFQKNTMKGTIPFGPFLALGAAIVFFWGPSLVSWYLSLLGIH